MRQRVLTSNLSPQASNLNDYVGYFLSPLDFLKECLTFFRFNAAFKRFVFFRLFIFNPLHNYRMMEFWDNGTMGGNLNYKEYILLFLFKNWPIISTFQYSNHTLFSYLTNQIPETISAVPRTL